MSELHWLPFRLRVRADHSCFLLLKWRFPHVFHLFWASVSPLIVSGLVMKNFSLSQELVYLWSKVLSSVRLLHSCCHCFHVSSEVLSFSKAWSSSSRYMCFSAVKEQQASEHKYPEPACSPVGRRCCLYRLCAPHTVHWQARTWLYVQCVKCSQFC